jgi:glutathione S-transferase
VRVFIAEKGLEVPVRQVDLKSGEHLEEAFRAINPDCTVPVLQLDDGTALTETLAICSYLESLSDSPMLLGGDPVQRAKVLMWNARVEQQGLGAVAESFRNHTRGFSGRALTGPHDYEQIPALVTRGRQRAEHFMAMLDAHLADNAFVVGDAYTMADITALITIDMAAWIKLPVPDAMPHLRRWHDAVSARPSAKA